MRNILIILIALMLLPACKTWRWGDTVHSHINKGEHHGSERFVIIEGTKKWGGECVLEYNPDEMVDPVENFSYWNKLGGLMPDITDNLIEGKHQSARVAWRVDPEDPGYFFIGYIVYVKGQDKPERDYLRDSNNNLIRIPVGAMFKPQVIKYDLWWGIYVDYNGQVAYKKILDENLKREKFLVVMDLYYGGDPVAPTDIDMSLHYIDTTWLYSNH